MLREHRRRRPERYVPDPKRRAGRRGRSRRRDRHHCSPDPAPPPRGSRRSPCPSGGRETLCATARYHILILSSSVEKEKAHKGEVELWQYNFLTGSEH